MFLEYDWGIVGLGVGVGIGGDIYFLLFLVGRGWGSLGWEWGEMLVEGIGFFLGSLG